MADVQEKRGPVEKTTKGWPINPFGVVVLVVLTVLITSFVAWPLINAKFHKEREIKAQLISPASGQIVRESNLPVELSVASIKDITKVQFWAKTYVDGNWQVIGEKDSSPYKIEWSIPENYRNKAIAITTHVYFKNGQITKDPGGWREGIIILSQ